MTAATGAWAQDYYLVGTMNDWCPSKQFQLTQNPGNLAEYMITLTLKEGTKLKVIAVDGEGNWTWYPAGDAYDCYVYANGTHTVYFRPDGQGGSGWHYGYIYLAAPAIPVTDLGNNTWEFTMPDYAVVANIEYDTDLELREENVNTTVLADWDGYEADVTLQRTLKANGWNTFAAPFSTAIPSGWTVKELESSEFNSSTGQLVLNFAPATSIEAGKPYMVKVTADEDLSSAAFQGTIVNKTTTTIFTTAVDFIPTLGSTTIEGTDAKKILFMASGNTLKHPGSMPAYMKGFRAYFQLKGDAVNAASFNLDFGNGETTGISSLTSEPSSNGEGSIYSLDGRRLSGKPAQKGVYIVNGKKMVIK